VRRRRARRSARLIEQAIRKYLAVATVTEQSFGDVVRELQARGPQMGEDDAMALAYEELHAMRRRTWRRVDLAR